MGLELNGHAKSVEFVASWALRALIALLMAVLVARSDSLDKVADTVTRLENHLTRVETDVKNVKDQLEKVEGRVYWIQRRTNDEERN